MSRLHLHAAAALLLGTARAGLRWCSLRSTQQMLHGIARIARIRAEPGVIAHAVTSAASRVPWTTTCLHEALAGEALLRQAGHECALRLGARRQEGTHAFHAWLECRHVAVIGATDVDYSVLTRRIR